MLRGSARPPNQGLSSNVRTLRWVLREVLEQDLVVLEQQVLEQDWRCWNSVRTLEGLKRPKPTDRARGQRSRVCDVHVVVVGWTELDLGRGSGLREMAEVHRATGRYRRRARSLM